MEHNLSQGLDRKSKDFFSIFWFMFWNLADAVSTILVFSRGGYEGNPIPALFSGTIVGFIAFKIFASIAIIICLWKVDRLKWLNVATVGLLLVTFWNLIVFAGA